MKIIITLILILGITVIFSYVSSAQELKPQTKNSTENIIPVNKDESAPSLQNVIKDWILTISAVITMLSLALGAWLSMREYRLKVKAETRLNDSTKVEMDIKLLTLFTEVMNIANGRSGYQVSEKVVELLLQPKILQKLQTSGVPIKDILGESVVTLPVGEAAQNAAIAVIGELAKSNEILKPVAIEALEILKTFKGDIAGKYLKELKVTG